MRLELPGLFDLQVNGFAGVDFNSRDLTADAVAQALERMRSTGVTRCLPTLITSSFEDFSASARVLASVRNPAIAGVHMEGPYISPLDGARRASGTSSAGRRPATDGSGWSRWRRRFRAPLN
jgi:N-acetylglucosamine-6-phosphate deacetylase